MVRHHASGITMRLAPVLSLLLLPACASQTALTAPRIAMDNPQSSGNVNTSTAEEPTGIVRLGDSELSGSARSRAPLTREPSVRDQAAKIVLLSYQADRAHQTDHQPQEQVVFTPAESRIDPALGRVSMADLYPDEYLADGGDRKLPVHYHGAQRLGFDTEDTIAEFTDQHGKSRVRASNRVAVYAPRFGSVQVAESFKSDVQVQQLFKAVDSAGASALNLGAEPHEAVALDGMTVVESRKRADGAETHRGQLQMGQATRAGENRKVDQGMQFQSLSIQEILQRDHGAVYQQNVKNALAWSRRLFPVLSASTSQATQVQARFTAQAVIGLEDNRAKQSDIHIVKMADRETAVAGDTIHFTIRYINTGDYDLSNVQIVDNLTPRLQYIADSAETDRAGEVLTEPNDEGSVILTFVLDEPLPARKTGTIEFDVRVK